jgi:hypothetical protein
MFSGLTIPIFSAKHSAKIDQFSWKWKRFEEDKKDISN